MKLKLEYDFNNIDFLKIAESLELFEENLKKYSTELELKNFQIIPSNDKPLED